MSRNDDMKIKLWNEQRCVVRIEAVVFTLLTKAIWRNCHCRLINGFTPLPPPPKSDLGTPLAIVMHFVNFFIWAKSHVILFVEVCSFSVVPGNFVLWRHSTSFDAIPQYSQYQIRNCSSCWCMFWRSLVVIEPFFTYDFQRTSLFYHIFCWPAVTQLILCRNWSPIFKLPLLLKHSPVSYTWPLVTDLWCCSLSIFMF